MLRKRLIVMMLILYNLLLAVCLPLLAPAALLRAKYRHRTLERLGLRLKCLPSRPGPVIWLHALSVGEVSSALPLVKVLRESIRPARIVFTASTRSGKELAEQLIAPYADLVLFSPFDLRCAICRYLEAIKPDLFILVETDFWPNWLDMLRRRNVPAMLVNGRISASSFATYRRFSFFFKPMFHCFDLLSMQTVHGRDAMLALGIPAQRLAVLGNLKYDLPARQTAPPDLAVEHGQRVWVCGSTHPGEEEIIFAAFKAVGANPCVRPSCIKGEHSDLPLRLILAPRQISRGSELLRLAHHHGLQAELRSTGSNRAECRILILDTIGELAGCYSLAHLAFIGGSLVDEGGHNPIEAAAQGVPVLFGPHMEDFAEIASDLTDCGGAKMVSARSLAADVAMLLDDTSLHTRMSGAAQQLVEQQRGGVEQHVRAIRKLLRKEAQPLSGSILGH